MGLHLYKRLLTLSLVAVGCKDKDIKQVEPPPPLKPPNIIKPAVPTVTPCTPTKVSKIVFAGHSGDISCPPPCLHNSPLVNTFPINGIDKDGKGSCSPEGVQVLPMSLVGGGCPQNATLSFDGKRLVGIDGTGNVTCQGQQLANATFELASATQTATGTKFRIVNVKPLAVSGNREGYQIVDVSDHDPKHASLCDVQASNVARSELGLKAADSYDTSAAEGSVSGTGSGADESLFAIALPDPLYSSDVQEIDNSHRFFNLACVSDALAKRTIDAIDVAATTEAEHLAALRMITATYCIAPRTAHDLYFHWEPFDTHGNPRPEARWKGDRVVCLENMRLTEMKLKDFSKLPRELTPATCEGGKCKGVNDWKKGVRTECKDAELQVAPKCDHKDDDYDYESFLPTHGNFTMQFKKKGEPGADDKTDGKVVGGSAKGSASKK